MTAEPYVDAAVHLRDELRRAWLRVEYEIRLGWSRNQASSPTVAAATDAATSSSEVAKLFAAARGERVGDEAGAKAVLDQWLELHRTIEARLAAAVAAGVKSPLVHLMRVFALSPRQWSTLMFALLPEADPNLVTAYRYLARDAQARGLDGRLLAQLVYDTPESRSLMARDLSSSSPLLRYQLIDLAPGDSLLFRRVRAASRLVHLLDGTSIELDPELAELAELRGRTVDGEFPAVSVQLATAAIRSSDVVLAVQGQRGLGKKLLLSRAATHWGQRVLEIDGKRLAVMQPLAQAAAIRSLIRELMLLDAIPVVADVDDVVIRDGDRDELPGFFSAIFDQWSGPIALTVNRERMPRIHHRPLVHLTLDVPPLGTRTKLWRQVMPSLEEAGADSLSGRFAIPGGIIVAAAQAAVAGLMPDSPPPGSEDLAVAVAAQLHQRISRLGKKLVTPFDLDDLIVDDDTRAALEEITSAARERRKVREMFKLRGAQGISVLFSGHPGVGKTMSGTVLAKRLGLDIYEVDLSQVVSKWLGETEKNLSDVFDAAEPGHVVLLFNEADTLFGKRTTDVKSSNDRYANMETNYLLQRLERFGGLAILTTNLTSSIDQAFKRRFTYDVFFSFPSPDMRAELWRRTLPERARSATIDFDSLAERYELSGGFIKVACERTAYVAGSNNVDIDEDMLRATIERMYRERGKLSSVGPLD